MDNDIISNSASYYDNAVKQYSNQASVEVAILQQEITLPEVCLRGLNLETLGQLELLGKTYTTPWNTYKDVIGNFYIPILFPLVQDGDSTALDFGAPESNNIMNKSIKTNSYQERNYISLIIPRYIAFEFLGKIPKGTKFLVTFVGGSTDINNINIIGIYGKGLMDLDSAGTSYTDPSLVVQDAPTGDEEDLETFYDYENSPLGSSKTLSNGSTVSYTDKHGTTGSFTAKEWANIKNKYKTTTNIKQHSYSELKSSANKK